MRLLQRHRDGSVTLTKDLITADIPPYAILSHTWGDDEDEVSLSDLSTRPREAQSKPGYKKIRFCIEQTRLDKLDYFWVDTCCIDKTNNVELTEALNSMYRWYQRATKCYVLLSDVSDSSADWAELEDSRWFRRGWTLQEMLAPDPASTGFYSRDGILIGTKMTLAQRLAGISGVPVEALCGTTLYTYSVEDRFKWQKHRRTKREEDKAYSLLGIFDLVMPLIYGEGEDHAYERLRDGIRTRHARDTLQSAGELSRQLRAGYLASWEPIQQSLIARTLLECSPGSFSWIFGDRMYFAWYVSPVSTRLTIMGNAGSGKSTAAVHIAETLKQRPRSLLTHYLFRRGQKTGPMLIVDALSTMCYQLVQQQQSLASGMSFPDLTKHGDLDWSWWTVSEFLRKLLTRGRDRQTVYMILDGIDECPALARGLLLAWLNAAQAESTRSKLPLKILFTCRPSPRIYDQLSGSATLNINAAQTATDIEKMIDERIELMVLHGRLGSWLESSLERRLKNHARGCFEWVVLKFDELDLCESDLTKEVIIAKLNSAPNALNIMYDAALIDCVRSGDGLFWQYMRWIAYSPRRLTIDELHEALEYEGRTLDWHDLADELSLARGRFVLLDGKYLSPSNPSVRDLLAYRTAMTHYTANEELAVTCITYLGQKKILEAFKDTAGAHHSSTYDQTCETLLAKYPLLHYATTSWSVHARMSKPSERLRQLLGLYLSLRDWRTAAMRMLAYVDLDSAYIDPSDHSALCVATYLDIAWFVQDCVEGGTVNLDWMTVNDDTALICAARSHSTKSASILLKAGADANLKDSRGLSALHWAARLGNVRMVEILLAHRVDSAGLDDNNMTPLDWALHNRHQDIVSILERRA